MTKLKLFKGMNQDERTTALESVIAGDLRLFVLLTDFYVVPEDLFLLRDDIHFLEIMEYRNEGGFFEFQDAVMVASNVLGNVPEIVTGLLDQEGFDVEYMELEENEYVSPDHGVFSQVAINLNHERLAVAPVSVTDESNKEAKTTTKTDPIKILIFRYFAKANGLYNFDRCMDFVLEDPEVDEGENGRILYTSFSGKLQNPLRKTIQSRYNNYLKEWKSQNP